MNGPPCLADSFTGAPMPKFYVYNRGEKKPVSVIEANTLGHAVSSVTMQSKDRPKVHCITDHIALLVYPSTEVSVCGEGHRHKW